MKVHPALRRGWPLLATLVGLMVMTIGSRSQCIPMEPEPSECTTNADCLDRDHYCAKEDGDCSGTGTCEARPDACPEYYAPVCGCNGETYANPCFAAAEGVNVRYEGECQPPPPTECESNDDCSFGVVPQYCAKEIGDCDGTGVCRGLPDACPDVWEPVCGCDDETYGNRCEAAAAGVNVDHVGTCEGPPAEECATNRDCAFGTTHRYCAKEVGDCAGTGTCEPVPVACADVWAPVCGCDGRTYGNACEAAAEGMNVRHEGRCEPPPPTECDSDDDCAFGAVPLYCRKAIGDCDGAGECRGMPDACPDVWAPVCGCDGETYGNRCEAAAAGVNVAALGSCDPTT